MRDEFEKWIKAESKARAAFRLDPAYVWESAYQAGAIAMRESCVNALAAKHEKHRGEPIAICGANRKNTASERNERRQGFLSGMLVAQDIIRALPVSE